MAGSSTRDALLERGALLFAASGVDRVTARQLHEAIGARNESALHYHFGGKAGLVRQIVVNHLAAVEERRAPLVAAIEKSGDTADLDALVHALAAPMAADLDTELGRAHLRMVAQLSHPQRAYQSPFQLLDAPAGRAVAGWLREALSPLPEAIRIERFAALRTQLVGLCGSRARLLDADGAAVADNGLFLANLIDMLVAGLRAEPSPRTLKELATDEN